MQNKKIFGLLTSAALLLNGAPLSVMAEEMVETGPSGIQTPVDSDKVALDSTNFPDSNFLNELKNNNPNATTAGDVKKIVVPSSAQNIDGIQYLTKAESFTMNGNNNIISVDLSNCTSLKDAEGNVQGNYPNSGIVITSNQALTSVILPEAEDLTSITITGNTALDSVDLSACESLAYVNLSNNSIDELDLSQNRDITFLALNDNDLYTLDATPCKNLEVLGVSRNKLYELKVPSKALVDLRASGNKLQSFDASELSKLTTLQLNNNMLEDIVLSEDATYSILRLEENHLASLDLSEINLGDNSNSLTVSPQTLYVDDEAKAIKITDYDSDFNYKKAYLQGNTKTPFEKDSIFTIPSEPGVAAKIPLNNQNTVVYVNGDNYTVEVDGVTIGSATITDPATSANTAAFTITKNGDGTVTVTGSGNYIGEAENETPVNAITLSNVTVTLKNDTLTYNGSAQLPPIASVTGKDPQGNTVTLSPSEYTATSSSNKDAGTPTLRVTPTGKYKGSAGTVTFTIEKMDLADAIVSARIVNATNDGSTTTITFSTVSVKPNETATADTIPLAANLYAINKPNTIAVNASGEATISEASLNTQELEGTITAPSTGNYTGSVSFSVTISTAANQNVDLTIPATEISSIPEAAPALTNSKSFYTYDTESSKNLAGATTYMQVNVIREALMNRLYNPNSGEHFYTKSLNEKDTLVSYGWQSEGIGWVAPTTSNIPVYRLYNPNAGDHHYTKDPNEKDTLVRVGWNYEGVGWYSADPTSLSDRPNEDDAVSSIEVFREYNPNAQAAGAHNYTINEIENSVLVSIGWIDEGIAWWALK